MDPNSLLSAVAVVVALVSGGGLGLQRSRVSALKGDLEDERARNVTLRQDVADLKVKDTEKTSQIATMTIKLEHAEQMARGQDHWLTLDKNLTLHNRAAEAHWAAEKQIWERIEQRLDGSPT